MDLLTRATNIRGATYNRTERKLCLTINGPDGTNDICFPKLQYGNVYSADVFERRELHGVFVSGKPWTITITDGFDRVPFYVNAYINDVLVLESLEDPGHVDYLYKQLYGATASGIKRKR